MMKIPDFDHIFEKNLSVIRVRVRGEDSSFLGRVFGHGNRARFRAEALQRAGTVTSFGLSKWVGQTSQER